MLELLKNKDYKRASLAVQKANIAVQMYEKAGFVKVEDQDQEKKKNGSITVYSIKR